MARGATPHMHVKEVIIINPEPKGGGAAGLCISVFSVIKLQLIKFCIILCFYGEKLLYAVYYKKNMFYTSFKVSAYITLSISVSRRKQ